MRHGQPGEVGRPEEVPHHAQRGDVVVAVEEEVVLVGGAVVDRVDVLLELVVLAGVGGDEELGRLATFRTLDQVAAELYLAGGI